MRFFLFIAGVFSLIFQSALFSQDTLKKKLPGPVFTFYSETARNEMGNVIFSKGNKLNVGKIPHYNQGGNLVRIIKFKNTGNEPLVISTVTTACGCDVPSYNKEKIYLPGETGEIQYMYDTKRTGVFHKTMTVQSNAVNSIETYLIFGEVLPCADALFQTK